MTTASVPTLPAPSPTPRSKDHVFVSYSSKDRGFVDRLAEDLRQRGHTVWIDFEGIHGGEEWKQSIADGIHASAVVLVVLTPESVVSEWVEAELRTARDLNKTIVPLLLRPVDRVSIPHPTIQHVHREVHYRDFTGGYQHPFEQLLTDLPRPKAGIPGHCQKIVARLAALPWGMDHFIQEEAKLLPLSASPYEDGVIRGQPENLLRRLREGQRLLVLGEPGIGKTVALERLAWELASGDPPVVPVIVRLFEYDGQPLLEWIRLRLVETGEIRLGSVEETRQFLRDMPFDCYFLLDGLNEVRPAHRDSVTGEITRLALEFARHRVAVTSRVQDDGWRVLRQGSAVQESYLVQPIRQEQARAYLAAHLGAESGHALWGQLDDRMRELAATPLLLWLVKEAWREACEQRGQSAVKMPDNRGALYRSFVGRMLRRDDERRLSQSIPEAERLTALERLALTMHEEKTLALPRDAVSAMVANPAVFEALLVNGLLLAVGDRVRFAPHQTMQEHFAACALKDAVMGKVQAKGLIRLVGKLRRGVLDYARDPWWAETFIQLAGLADDPNALARTLAEINPWLAWWCVQEGRRVDAATEQTIRQRSEALVHSKKVQDRRSAAQTLARLQTPRVIPPLAQLVTDEDEEVWRTANDALLVFGDAGLPSLADLLKTERLSATARLRIAHLLAGSKSQDAFVPLMALAVDADEEVGEVACQAVQVFGDPATKSFLDVLGSSKIAPAVKARIGRALAKVGDPRPGVGRRRDGAPDFAWCAIPTGRFRMGGDPAAYDAWEGGEFELNYPFWIAKYPVTYVQYEAFVEAGGYREQRYWTEAGWQDKGDQMEPYRWDDPQWHIANHPVIGVTWYEAYAYTQWLDDLRQAGKLVLPSDIPAGYVIRLPRECEWEKAARYPDGRKFPWGDDYVAGYANIDERASSAGPNYLERTTAVGLYPQGANPAHGACDLSGNVWEWCLTAWADQYQSPETENNDPSGGAVRCARGGSWLNRGLNCRAASRDWGNPRGRNNCWGCRVVVSVPIKNSVTLDSDPSGL